jgi:iron(III) transport system permease protein
LLLSIAASLLVSLLIALPVVAIFFTALQSDADSVAILGHLASTVLADYALTSALLCVLVGVGVAALGALTACAVSLFEFKGRALFEWLVLLPLAMPAYVVAFAYTDFLQFSGPAQSAIRAAFGLNGRVFPEIRNVGGAAFVLTVTLYPYVYLLARAALTERATHLMEAARLLGAPLKRRIFAVALPLARPALAAGIALALMETLADFGVTSYFGIQSFTVGIYKAWLAMGNVVAAAALAACLLLTVAGLLWVERRAQRRLRFTSTRGGGVGVGVGQNHGSKSGQAAEARPIKLTGRRALVAQLICVLPTLFGFFLPVLMMLRPLLQSFDGPVQGAMVTATASQWINFLRWSGNSLMLAASASLLATLVALMLGFAARRRASLLTRLTVNVVGLGYAVPGAVVVVGLLLPVAALQSAFPALGLAAIVTTTVLGIMWAYLARFSAVALQSVQSGYARIPASYDDSARILGATDGRLFRAVHAPLLARSTWVAALLVFVDVMKELPATLVLRPFNYDTLAVTTYQLAKDERLGEAALPALALVAVGLLPVMVLSRALRAR